MNKQNKTLAAVFLLSVAFTISGCITSATHVMLGQAKPSTSFESVKIYAIPPKSYEQIALVEGSSSNSGASGEQGKMDAAIKNIKIEAAKLGANGIILQGTGTTNHGVIMSGSTAIPINHKAASGIAIYVLEE